MNTPTLIRPETKCLADELAAATSIRRITLADGTVIDHEVGPLSWVDVIRYQRIAAAGMKAAA